MNLKDRLLKNFTAIQGFHVLAKGYLRARGYQWEVRHYGEVRLGYWKKIIRARNPRRAYPKRFVMVPGFGDSALSWSIVVGLLNPILRQKYDEIILLDFPGFAGFLSTEKCFASMDQMIASVNDTLDSLKPHTILGHSLGAWLTAFYASACGAGERPLANKLNYSGPELVLLGSPSGAFVDLETRQEWQELFVEARETGFKVMKDRLFAKRPFWFPLIESHFSQFFLREDIRQFMKSFSEKHLIEPLCAHIHCEVWLFWGENDTLIPAEHSKAWMRSLSPNKKDRQNLVLMKGVGHSPHLEAPTTTAAALGQIILGKAPHRFGNRWWKVMKNSIQGA